MERAWLEVRLASGRSIESIAREVDRDPSTVSYWVRKHGLRSRHAPRHVARGGLVRDDLAKLVDAGASIAEIADAVGRSAATVRHWLHAYGLATARASYARQRRAMLDADREGLAECPRHGLTPFVPRPGGGHRCLSCRAEGVTRRRRKVKALLVAEAGGACVLCGYERSPAALHFHHRDPTTKDFTLRKEASGGRSPRPRRRRGSASCSARTAMPRSRREPLPCPRSRTAIRV